MPSIDSKFLLLYCLDALDPMHHRALQVLAVSNTDFNITEAKLLMNATVWPFDFINMGWRKMLLNGNILQTSAGSRFKINQLLKEILCQRAAIEGVYTTIIKAIKATSRYSSPYQTAFGGEGRKLLYTRGDSDRIRVILGTQNAPFTPLATLPVCYQWITQSPIDMAWLATIDSDIKFQLLYHIVQEIIHGNCPFVTLNEVKRMIQEDAIISNEVAGRCLLASAYIWQGNTNLAEHLLPESDEPAVLALRGRIALMHGDGLDAVVLYQSAITKICQTTKSNNPGLMDEDQIFHLFACLGSDQTILFHKTIEVIKRQQKKKQTRYGSMIEWIILLQRCREQQTLQDIQHLSSTIVENPCLLLFVTIGLYWLDALAKMQAWFWTGLVQTSVYAWTHQMDWLAWEVNNILKDHNNDFSDAPALPFAEIHSSMEENGIQSCLQLYTKQKPWQVRLQALKLLTDESQSFDLAINMQRIVWLFYIDNQTIEDIEPRVQKVKKNGQWGKGYKVALKRLHDVHERKESFPFLSEQDKRICKCINEDQEYEYYYDNMAYSFDCDDAIRQAVDHPSLFLNTLNTPLTIQQDEVVLQVVQEKSDICISIHPFPEMKSSTPFLQWKSPNELVLYDFTAEQRNIANILGNDGLLVPKSAQDEALESIAAIAPLLTVHSAVEGAGEATAQHVEADSRLHLHLQPAGDGLQINCFVRPFADAPLLMRPGEGGHTVFTEHDGATLQTRRDLAQEIKHSQTLFSACSHLDADEGWHWRLEEPQQALETLDQLQELAEKTVLLAWPEGKSLLLAKKMGVHQLRLSMHKEQDWFEIEGEVEVDDNQVLSIKNLLALVGESSGRFIRLADNQFLSLSNALYQRLDALQSVTDQGRFHGLAASAIEELTDGMKVRKNRHWQDHLQALANAQDFQPELPSTLQAELRDYQQEGFAWMARLTHWGAGACLADDMGLGKTVQALALMLMHAPHGAILVIAPTSVCMNWESEATRFAPTLKLHNFADGDRQETINNAGAFDVVICSYALLQRNSKLLTAHTWQVVVLDEAQAIKNSLTQRSKAAMALQAKVRVITTGTPIENHLGELWNLFQFINPGLLGSLESFNRRFAGPIEGDHNKDVAKRLKQLIHPFILRRLKSEVLTELPPRTEITIHVDLSSEEMALYEATRQRAMERIAESSDEGGGARHIKILAEIMRLRRACCHPSLIMPNTSIAGSKLAAFAECVEELREGNHKALVFSQFIGHLAILRDYLDKKKISYQYLDGSTPIAKRKQQVDAFQAGEGDLFLISLKAGGSGLNLTAADFVLHMDPWWNPAVEDQASDRAHRIGQTRPVTIYRFIAKHTIEDKIVQLHQQKRALADSLLEGSNRSGKMSLKDIMRLVEESEADG